MTRTHVLVLALAASVLATFFASCCCCKGGDDGPKPPQPLKVSGVFQTPERFHDDGTPWLASGGGSTNSTAHATGTFNHSTGLVLYDVDVDYVLYNPTKIQVWSAPFGTTPLIHDNNEIAEEPPPTLAPANATWARSISGPYTGATSYLIGIKVTFGPGQGFELHRGSFTGLYEPVDG